MSEREETTDPSAAQGAQGSTSQSGPVEESGPEAIQRVFMALHPSVEIDGCSGSALYEPEVEHRGNPGWLHGGMAATLLDHVSARLANAALDGPVVTGKLEIRYLRPVSLAAGPYRLEARYEPAKSGRSIRYLVRIEASISDESGPLVEASSLFVPRPDPQSRKPGREILERPATRSIKTLD